MVASAATARGLDADSPSLIAEYRAQLMQAHGAWARPEGTAHTPEAWEQILRRAVAAESASVPEMVALSAFAFVERVTFLTPEAVAALQEEYASLVLQSCHGALAEEALCSPEVAKEWLRALRHEFRATHGLRGKLVMFPLRAAWTGSMVGPCLGIVASLLGCARCRSRLEDHLSCDD